MSEFEKLHEQAARLLALALKARERGDDLSSGSVPRQGGIAQAAPGDR